MRFAIYFAPRPGTALAEAGADWLGRDAFLDRVREQPRVAGIDPARFAALTGDARRYGFHATLKPPFALKDSVRRADLLSALRSFAIGIAGFEVRLRVSVLDGFVALTPSSPSRRLDELAAACVRAFEPHRAQLAAEEIEKRRRVGLTAAEDANLLAWGYPWVFDTFRFHMTLTGRVEGAEADAARTAARDHFADPLAAPVEIDTIALFEERHPGDPFVVVETVRLAIRIA